MIGSGIILTISNQYLKEYHNPRTGNPVLNQPVCLGTTHSFELFSTGEGLWFHDVFYGNQLHGAFMGISSGYKPMMGIYPLVIYHNYRKSPFLMGKWFTIISWFTVNQLEMVIFHSHVSLPEGNQ